MSTPCNIGILLKNGNIKYVYCHYDGFPHLVGKILLEKYTTTEKINSLISKGRIMSLGFVNNLEIDPQYFTDHGVSLMVDEAKSIKELQTYDFTYVYSSINKTWLYTNRKSEVRRLATEVVNKEIV